jgi:hypothetical protein
MKKNTSRDLKIIEMYKKNILLKILYNR